MGKSDDFHYRRQQCISSGVLFEDPDFPATDKSLFFSDEVKQKFGKEITWLRPKEFCDSPQFYVDGVSRFDAIQGEIGDCWFLAATANLTLHKELFSVVVPDDNSFEDSYAGIFHFR